jgi:hypothetical protein
MKAATAARFLSLLFCALTLAPALAHLLELPNKIGLPRDEYLVVQQIYRGWWMLGIVVFGALLSTLALTIVVRKRPGELGPALSAFLSIVATQAIFWTFTFPANQQTANWTQLPDHWQELRMHWEYSHAASAMLDLVALIAVIIAVLKARNT